MTKMFIYQSFLMTTILGKHHLNLHLWYHFQEPFKAFTKTLFTNHFKHIWKTHSICAFPKKMDRQNHIYIQFSDTISTLPFL